MTSRFLSLLLCLSAFVAAPAFAELKIGVVDMQAVLKSTVAGKAAAKKFQSPGSVARHLLKCKGVITARMYWFGKLADKPRSAAPTATQPEAASVAY